MNCSAPDAQLDPESVLAIQAPALEGSGSRVIYDDALHPDRNDRASWGATQDPDATSPAPTSPAPHGGSHSLASAPPLVALALSVDAAANRRRISPDIYGIQGRVSADRNQTPNQSMARTLRLPVRRWGGNATSRYNYTIDATNVAADWFFENIGKTAPVPADPKESSAVNDFIRQDRSTGTRTLVTVPLLGWVAKDRSSCTFDATLKDSSGNPVYGLQDEYDTSPGKSHCGNGILEGGTPIVTTDPQRLQAQRLHAHQPAPPSFVEDWVRYLVSKFGQAKDGGVAFYNLDNEPMLWNDTHRDVFPDPLDYEGLYDRTHRYAAAIKAADPSAMTLGPVAWGWEEYFYSALDRVVSQQCRDEGKTKWWQCTQDRKAHGDLPLVAWYLDKLRQYEQQHGIRLLDYLDLHYYPEASGVARRPAGSLELQALRLRSTRSLWDPSYVDESWIAEPVRLIPRMRQWVDQYYPGTKLAITEYNFGALEHINGALAQADVLGIFGREGVDLATLWWYRDPTQLDFNLSHPAAFAFRMYRNYDGAGHGFGNVSTKAESTDPDRLAVYAAHRTDDGALTIMVINKSGQELTAPLALSNFSPAPNAKVFRYSGAVLGAIEPKLDQPVTSNGFTAAYPPNSITLLVLASGAPAEAVCAGATAPGTTAWKQHTGSGGAQGLFLDVNTSACKFTSTPRYFTSLGGDTKHWRITGATSIYSPTSTGFRIYVFDGDGPITPADANARRWHIQWQALPDQQLPPGVCTGGTPRGATAWKQYTGSPEGPQGLVLDVDTSVCGYTATPRYITSLGGDARHWRTTGATSIYAPTPTGFRIYVFDKAAAITPADANALGWHINWQALPDQQLPPGACTGGTPSGATAWQQYPGSPEGPQGLVVDVSTSACGYTATPRYITSLGGNTRHWRTTGATSIYSPTATGFRIFVFDEGGPVTPADANARGWHITWQARPE